MCLTCKTESKIYMAMQKDEERQDSFEEEQSWSPYTTVY